MIACHVKRRIMNWLINPQLLVILDINHCLFYLHTGLILSFAISHEKKKIVKIPAQGTTCQGGGDGGLLAVRALASSHVGGSQNFV